MESARTYSNSEDDGDEESSDESFDSFLRTELDELVTTEEHTCRVERFKSDFSAG